MEGETSTPSADPVRILLIDDDKAHERLIQAAAEEGGFVTEVLQASTVPEAHQHARERGPEAVDLVVATLTAPGMPAAGFFEEITEQLGLPVVVLGGKEAAVLLGDAVDHVSLIEEGPIDHTCLSSILDRLAAAGHDLPWPQEGIPGAGSRRDP